MEKYKLVEKITKAILNGERVLTIGDGILELPEGPAIPVVETHNLLLLILDKFLDIKIAIFSLTAPWFFINFEGILRIKLFDLLE